LRVATGEPLDIPGLVATVGPHLVVRNELNELWLVAASGDRRKISSGKCNARVLHLDAARELVLFGCASAHGARRDLFLRTQSARKQLHIDVAAFEQDTRFDGQLDLVPLYPHNDSLLLDLNDGDLLQLPQGSRAVAVFGGSALVDVGSALQFVRLDTSGQKPSLRWTKTGRVRTALQPLLLATPIVAVGKDLFDLDQRVWRGSFTGFPLSLSTDAQGLVPRTDATATRLAQGPLRWEIPSLPTK
jgi:hypothetical protein